eukprot:Opistho-2@75777
MAGVRAAGSMAFPFLRRCTAFAAPLPRPVTTLPLGIQWARHASTTPRLNEEWGSKKSKKTIIDAEAISVEDSAPTPSTPAGTPVSPLDQLFSITEKTADEQESKRRDGLAPVRDQYAHSIRQIRISIWKLNIVARLVRRMTVEDALKQLKFVNRSARMHVSKAIFEAAQKAKNTGLTYKDLYVDKCFVGRGKYERRRRIGARSHTGLGYLRRSHQFVVLRPTVHEKLVKAPQNAASDESTRKYLTPDGKHMWLPVAPPKKSKATKERRQKFQPINIKPRKITNVF